jgi:hypothetical protein
VNELEKLDPEIANGIAILAPALEKELSREIECAWHPGEFQSFPFESVSVYYC